MFFYKISAALIFKSYPGISPLMAMLVVSSAILVKIDDFPVPGSATSNNGKSIPTPLMYSFA